MKYKHLLTLHGLPKQISKQIASNIDIVFVNRRRKIERSTTQMKMRRSLNRENFQYPLQSTKNVRKEENFSLIRNERPLRITGSIFNDNQINESQEDFDTQRRRILKGFNSNNNSKFFKMSRSSDTKSATKT
mmetsp:Transcript_22530/g.22352  ORF Transcript_22530/g.22352 Transcript_22530/m.22352 type:complete len:132 (-) Transcript_22530:6-401(-)